LGNYSLLSRQTTAGSISKRAYNYNDSFLTSFLVVDSRWMLVIDQLFIYYEIIKSRSICLYKAFFDKMSDIKSDTFL